MKSPEWLQELRELLAITTYAGRHEALTTWEQRWLVELHAKKVASREIIENADIDILARLGEALQRVLGHELGQVMVAPRHGPSAECDGDGEPMIEVRGDVMAIRREPKPNA
jgi:hypothetical protein